MTTETNSVTRFLKMGCFSCLGSIVFSFLMLAVSGLVIWWLIGISNANDERVKNLPEMTGILTTDSAYFSPIGKKPASLIMLSVYYEPTPGRHRSRGPHMTEFKTFIFPERLLFRTREKDYVVQPPDGFKDLKQRADLYFPDLHKSNAIRLQLRPKDTNQKIPPGLLGHDPVLDCILGDTSWGEHCADDYISVAINEFYYEQNETVTLKGKIEGDKFILFSIDHTNDDPIDSVN